MAVLLCITPAMLVVGRRGSALGLRRRFEANALFRRRVVLDGTSGSTVCLLLMFSTPVACPCNATVSSIGTLLQPTKCWSIAQVVFSFDSEGGIAKMVANKIALGPKGEWLLPFWREMGGNDCTHAPGMHGRAGVLISEDQVTLHAWHALFS